MRFAADFSSRHRVVLIVLALASLLAGVARSRPASGVAAPTGEATKPAGRVIADAAAALRSVRSYRFQLVQRYDGGTFTTNGEVTSSHRARFQVTNGETTTETVVIGADAYFKADRNYWIARSRGRMRPELLDRIADRWIEAGTIAGRELVAFATQMTPQVFARCLQLHDAVQTVGAVPYAGDTAVQVDAVHDAPGGVRGTLYVSAAAPHLPLALIQGESDPGGHFDHACENPYGAKVYDSTERFMWFDRASPIKAPTHLLRPGPAETLSPRPV
jgi:hypothetical protein